MFSLHETSQRRVCRVAFIACAAVPTLITLVWIAYSLRPWRESDWQRTLSQQLHVHGSVENVISLRPGNLRLIDVQLADLRSQMPLVALNEVRTRWRGSELTLIADQLLIESASFPSLAATLATWMSAADLPAVQLQASRLKIEGPSQQTVLLRDVRMQSQQKAGQTQQLAIQAMLLMGEQREAAHPLKLVIQQSATRTTATLHTDAGRLPSWLLVDVLPSVARCDEASFSGSVRLEGNARNVSGSLRGRIAGLSLSDWLGPASPHTVRGLAQVELDQLTWNGDRVVSAHGNLRGANGAVGDSLLIEAVKRLYCVAGSNVVLDSAPDERLLSFDELACEFHISDAGITLKGKCASLAIDSPGCLLTAGGRALLLEPTYSNMPVAQLVQLLSQAASSWLPASQEAHAMAGKLPLPSVGPQTQKDVAERPKDSKSR